MMTFFFPGIKRFLFYRSKHRIGKNLFFFDLNKQRLNLPVGLIYSDLESDLKRV